MCFILYIIRILSTSNPPLFGKNKKKNPWVSQTLDNIQCLPAIYWMKPPKQRPWRGEAVEVDGHQVERWRSTPGNANDESGIPIFLARW